MMSLEDSSMMKCVLSSADSTGARIASLKCITSLLPHIGCLGFLSAMMMLYMSYMFLSHGTLWQEVHAVVHIGGSQSSTGER